MRGVIVAILLSLPIWLGIILLARTAECDWCVATFCGSSSECPAECVCAIEMGEVTGHCVGYR